MAHLTTSICRKCSIAAILLLILQASYAQYNFDEAQNWVKGNLKELGGRAVLVILKDGKIVYNIAENELTRKQKIIGKFIARKQGKDAKTATENFSSTTKARIASCSKWLSAALVMTFVDEGKLKLTDSIGKFLPIMSANGKGNIQIWQCLSHLTGINGGTLKEGMAAMKTTKTMDEAMAQIAVQPMEGEPGKTFHYGNTGLQIAAAVIEKISGKNFEALFQERIAKPCNMVNTDYGNGPVPLAAGGALSTAEDYINFLQMILQEGNFKDKQVLSKTSIISMQKNSVAKDAVIKSSPAEAGNWGYGFGEWVMDSPLQTSPDGGDLATASRSNAITSPGLFGTFPWVDYEKNYAAILFTFNINSKGRNERYKQLKKIVDEAIAKP